MNTIEEHLSYWKSRCAQAEKDLKLLEETSEKQKIDLIEMNANLTMWKNRATNAECLLRQYNE